MRVRTVEEVYKEMKECNEEWKYYLECANLNNGKGYWTWGDPSYVPKMNACLRHRKNLYLELNRIKIREWEQRAKLRNRTEAM